MSDAEIAAKDREIAAQKAAYEHVKSVMHKHEESLSETHRQISDKDREIAALRDLLMIVRPLVKTQDLDNRIAAALSGSPAPDLAEWDEIGDRDVGFMRVPRAPNPAEAMRAKCEEIAREEEVKNGSVNGTGAARRINERIAALKVNGEGE